jgi:hypothetical protein
MSVLAYVFFDVFLVKRKDAKKIYQHIVVRRKDFICDKIN